VDLLEENATVAPWLILWGVTERHFALAHFYCDGVWRTHPLRQFSIELLLLAHLFLPRGAFRCRSIIAFGWAAAYFQKTFADCCFVQFWSAGLGEFMLLWLQGPHVCVVLIIGRLGDFVGRCFAFSHFHLRWRVWQLIKQRLKQALVYLFCLCDSKEPAHQPVVTVRSWYSLSSV